MASELVNRMQLRSKKIANCHNGVMQVGNVQLVARWLPKYICTQLVSFVDGYTDSVNL